ncbi:MAG: sigma-54-dependent Fis family transcriptional regulator [Nitrospira sp.]|nr:sigma-54-dependent Fis family transcriptional regulator [Nitrospira sp.]
MPRSEPSRRPIAAALNFSADHEEAINRSHERCAALGLSRIERPDLGLLDRAEFEIACTRNLRLHQHAAPVMELLYDQIVNTHSMVVLTDAAGTIVHAIGDDDFLARASKIAVRPGAIWSEAHKGTNAAGTALITEAPTLVHADEHYLHANHFLTCSAAPILDPRGNILGVIDVSGDHRGYHRHTMALVKMSARMIENRWLTDDLRNVMRLHFHSRVDFIGTLLEGIIAVRPDGRIVGANRGALEQLGMSGASLRMHSLEGLFGTSVGVLVDRFRSPLATPLPVRTPGGRHLHLHARFDWPVWSSLAEAVATQIPAAAVPSPALRSAADWMAAQAKDEWLGAAPADPKLTVLAQRLRRALRKHVPAVLIGEVGTGKQWLARAVHHALRPERPFIALTCGDLTAQLLESVWNDDACGTIYLEDIGHLPAAAQHRLLLLLDAQAAAPRALVCASREPWRSLRPPRLHDGLFFRLDALTLRVPTLRERSDLDQLARSIVEHEAAGNGPRLDDDVVELLRAHRWPGNLRQLHDVLRAAVALSAEGPTLTRAHLSEDFVDEACASSRAPAAAAPGAPSQLLDEMTFEAITHAVDAAQGNIAEASRRLGISRNTIYRKLRWKTGAR